MFPFYCRIVQRAALDESSRLPHDPSHHHTLLPLYPAFFTTSHTMKHFAILAALSAALPYVAAHGFVSQVVIDGQTYEGNVPNQYKGEP